MGFADSDGVHSPVEPQRDAAGVINFVGKDSVVCRCYMHVATQALSTEQPPLPLDDALIVLNAITQACGAAPSERGSSPQLHT